VWPRAVTPSNNVRVLSSRCLYSFTSRKQEHGEMKFLVNLTFLMKGPNTIILLTTRKNSQKSTVTTTAHLPILYIRKEVTGVKIRPVTDNSHSVVMKTAELRNMFGLCNRRRVVMALLKRKVDASHSKEPSRATGDIKITKTKDEFNLR
jgi:hypothetical protein